MPSPTMEQNETQATEQAAIQQRIDEGVAREMARLREDLQKELAEQDDVLKKSLLETAQLKAEKKAFHHIESTLKKENNDYLIEQMQQQALINDIKLQQKKQIQQIISLEEEVNRLRIELERANSPSETPIFPNKNEPKVIQENIDLMAKNADLFNQLQEKNELIMIRTKEHIALNITISEMKKKYEDLIEVNQSKDLNTPKDPCSDQDNDPRHSNEVELIALNIELSKALNQEKAAHNATKAQLKIALQSSPMDEFRILVQDISRTFDYAFAHQRAYATSAASFDKGWFFRHNNNGIKNSLKIMGAWSKNLNLKLLDIIKDALISPHEFSANDLKKIRIAVTSEIQRSIKDCIKNEKFSSYTSHSFRAYLHHLDMGLVQGLIPKNQVFNAASIHSLVGFDNNTPKSLKSRELNF